jgi:hypothetical protein
MDGDDLLSLDEQINRGLLSYEEAEKRWKWEHNFEMATDRQYVSLWDTLREAREWRDEHGGIILACRVDPERAGYMKNTDEGHPAMLDRIPSEQIQQIWPKKK